jgi:DNA (cytosine-5)-methyltransferase 1
MLRLLDLFSGAGGAAYGYMLAGFHVTGVDLKAQPRYRGDVFIQADALEFVAKHGDQFDVIHASPPCQAYSVTRSLTTTRHPQLIAAVRQALQAAGCLYVIENVEGAPLQNALMLCGTMFPGLHVYRHRLFEVSPTLFFPPFTCNHGAIVAPSKGMYHTLEKYRIITCVGHNFQAEAGRKAMGIDWMTRTELAQAIPPAYTQWIGEQLRQVCLGRTTQEVP